MKAKRRRNDERIVREMPELELQERLLRDSRGASERFVLHGLQKAGERMNFIEAVIAISKSKDLYLCEDETELDGRHSSICVYSRRKIDHDTGPFIGKLRWPRDGRPASVDESVIEAIESEKAGK
jgi:hypothetical protein